MPKLNVFQDKDGDLAMARYEGHVDRSFVVVE